MSDYDGNIPLFFIGCVFILIGEILFRENQMKKILLNINEFTNGNQVIQLATTLKDIIKENELNARQAKIYIQGYIINVEETCNDKNCSLKKYLHIQTNNKIFLYQHIEELYQRGLTKFSNCIQLRISYAIFLIEEMNKKKQSLKEIAIIEKSTSSIEEEFIVYRYKKYIEDDFLLLSEDIYDEDNNNKQVDSNISYKYNYQLFKKFLQKISRFYISFWTLLYNNNQDKSQLETLSKLGTKITYKIKEISQLYNKMHRMNPKEPDPLFLYSEYLDNIRNKFDEAENIRKNYIKLLDLKEEISDEECLNFEYNNLISNNNQYQFVILSSSNQSFGIIQNISLSLCSLFGYMKNDIIGKSIDLLLPEIIVKGHKDALIKTLFNYKLNKQTNTSSSKLNFKYHNSFAKNNARYLIPITFKTTCVTTENQEILFIAQFIHSSNSNVSKEYEYYYVLTNNFLVIESFTLNSIPALSLNSNLIRNGVDVTKFIKQFHEQFLKCALEAEAETPEEKLHLKHNIIDKYYESPKEIIWKRFEINESKYSEDLTETHLSKTTSERNFVLSIERKIINEEHIGFLFRFEKKIPISKIISTMTPEQLNKTVNKNFNLVKENSLFGNKLYHNKDNVTSNEQENNQHSIHKSNNNYDFLLSLNNNEMQIKESKMIFQIDLNKMSFVPNPKNQAEIKDNIKKLVFAKIQLMKNDNRIQEISSKDNDESSSNTYSQYNSSINNSNSDYYSSSININEGKNPSSKSKYDAHMYSNISKHDFHSIEDNYYKINFTPIKFFQYNFNNGIVEATAFDNKTQIEMKMHDDSKEEDQIYDENNKDKDLPSFIPTVKKVSCYNLTDISKGLNHEDSANKDLTDEDLLSLQKKIEYALSKEESQPTIRRLQLISLIAFIILLGYFLIWFGCSMISFSILEINFNLIRSISSIVMNNAYSLARVRQLTFLQDKKYKEYLTNNKTADLEMVLKTLSNTSYNTNNHINNIINSASLILSKEKVDEMNNMQIPMSTMQTLTWKEKKFYANLLTSLTQVNTEFIILGEDMKTFHQYNSHVYFVLMNGANGIAVTSSYFISAFLEAFNYHIEEFHNMFICIYICGIPLIFIFNFSINNAYTAVSYRKDNYLKVFFEINHSIIKGLLTKCEKFNQQIKTDSINEFIALDNNLSESLDGNYLLDNNNNDNSKLQLNHAEKKKKKKGKIGLIKQHSKTVNNSSELLWMKIKIFLLFFVQMCFISAIFGTFYSNLTLINSYVFYYMGHSFSQLSFLFLFHNINELVTITNYFSGLLPNQTIDDFFSSFFMTLESVQTYYDSVNNAKLPSNFQPFFNQIYNNDLCSLPQLAFPKGVKCNELFYQTPTFGLDVFLIGMYNQVIILNSLHKYYVTEREKRGFVYNLTLESTPNQNEVFPNYQKDSEEYIRLHPMNELNEDEHVELMKAYTYFLQPGIEALHEEFSKCLEEILQETSLKFIIIIFSFGIIDIIGYIFIWKPFEIELNNIIYKTKSLLSIIPSDVLGMMSSARKLLEINQYSIIKRKKKKV